MPVLDAAAPAALPCAVDCVLCGAQHSLEIRYDALSRGQWGSCGKCGFYGDMIQLAAAVWKLDIRDTLPRLCQVLAAPPTEILNTQAVHDYIHTRVERPQQLQEFWRHCQQSYWQADSAEVRDLQRMMFAVPQTDWPQRGGRLLGAATVADVRKALRYRPRQIRYLPRKMILLVTPFYDLPQRICGFLLLHPQRDSLQLTYCSVYNNKTRIREAGVTALGDLPTDVEAGSGTTLFCGTSAELVLQMQLKHLRESASLLPVAAVWEDAQHQTRTAWEWLRHRHVICWGTQPLPTICQASRGNAAVALLEKSSQQMQRDVRRYGAVEILHRIEKLAVPWQTALEHYLADKNELQISAVLHQLELTSSELAAFIHGCKPAAKRQLQQAQDGNNRQRRIRFEHRWILERSGGWFTEDGDRLCNAVIRILQIVHSASEESYYCGKILLDSQSYPFTAAAAVLRKQGLFKWAEQYLQDELQAGPLYYYPSWNSRSLQLALTMHPPQNRPGEGNVGWNEQTRTFSFPSFAIHSDGRVEERTLPLDNLMPACSLRPPRELPQQIIDQLSSDCPETRVFWSILAAMATYLIAPAIHRTPPGILLDGPGARVLGTTLLQSLGCRSISVCANDDLPQLLTKIGRHQWPVLLHKLPKPQEWLNHAAAARLVPDLDWAANRVLALHGRSLLQYHCILNPSRALEQAAPLVLPAYLQTAVTAGLRFIRPNSSLQHDVMEDMAVWFAASGGDPVALRDRPAAPAWLHFLHLVFHSQQQGVLSTARRDGNVTVSKENFSRAVHVESGLRPDILLIDNALEAAPIPDSSTTETVWTLPADWWDQHWQEWKDAR